MLFRKQHIHDQQNNARGDRRVCNIKRRPVEIFHVPLDEIDDLGIAEPVDQIAHSPACNQGKGDDLQALFCGPDEETDDGHGYDRHGNEEQAPPDTRHIGKYPERRALIPDMRQVKETRDDRDRLIQTNVLLDQVLRCLIEDEDKADDRTDPIVFILQLRLPCKKARPGFPIEPFGNDDFDLIRNPQCPYRFPAHLPQTSGWSFTAPTVSLYIQHRPHFTPRAGPAVIRSPFTASLV